MHAPIKSWKNRLNFDEVCDRLENSEIRDIKPISEKLETVDWAVNSSNIYYVVLQCGLECVFRPYPEISYNSSFDTTVLAYQLSQTLALDVVPPAVERQFSKEELDVDTPAKGSLQLFVSPDVWRLKDQTYEFAKKKTKPSERQKVELFQFIAGLCDRHRGNTINDLTGDIALIDVGDMILPKMIVRGHWEFLLVGSLMDNLSIDDRLDFEEQPIQRINNPRFIDLETLFKPFIEEKFIGLSIKTWMNRIENCSENERYVDFVLWQNGLWVSCPRNNYKPIEVMGVPENVLDAMRKVSVDKLNFPENGVQLKLVESTILYRIEKLLKKETQQVVVEEVNSLESFVSLFALQERARKFELETQTLRRSLKSSIRKNELARVRKKTIIQAEVDKMKQVREGFLRGQETILRQKSEMERMKEGFLRGQETILREKSEKERMKEGFLRGQETILRLKSSTESLQRILDSERAARRTIWRKLYAIFRRNVKMVLVACKVL